MQIRVTDCEYAVEIHPKYQSANLDLRAVFSSMLKISNCQPKADGLVVSPKVSYTREIHPMVQKVLKKRRKPAFKHEKG